MPGSPASARPRARTAPALFRHARQSGNSTRARPYPAASAINSPRRSSIPAASRRQSSIVSRAFISRPFSSARSRMPCGWHRQPLACGERPERRHPLVGALRVERRNIPVPGAVGMRAPFVQRISQQHVGLRGRHHASGSDGRHAASARIARATAAELDALAKELPPVALRAASDGLPWWHHDPQTLDLPALHCPDNAASFRSRIQYSKPDEQVVRECYTGPHIVEAHYLIAQLRAAGDSVIPPAEDREEDQ